MHEGAGGQLRQVTHGPDESIVELGRHDVRHGAEPLHELLEPRQRGGRVARRRRQDPGAAVEEVGSRLRESAARRAGHRMPTDEGQRRPRRGGLDDPALRAAGVGDERPRGQPSVELIQQLDVGENGRREHDQIRVGGARQIGTEVEADDAE